MRYSYLESMIRRTATTAARVARTLVAVGLLLFGVTGLARAGGNDVVVLDATGVVDNVLAGYLEDGIATAAADGAAAVIVRLNTPGGSLDATQQITSAFLESPVPVIVYVSPAGGYAASAGTFITLAANLSYMAPGTNIGAASPVGSGGQDITGTEGEKVRNHAIANITSIAEARGRPTDWAASTVSDAKSYTASEAVAAGAVDGIATDLDAVIAAANGQTVTVMGTPITLDLSGAQPADFGMNPFQGFLHLLSDPNIAAVLFTIGSLGLVYELISPNFVTGTLGALALILAFIGSQSLPLNIAGVLLIGLGMVLFVLEVSVVSHGLLTLGGLVCLALGLSALYTQPLSPTGPDVSVALPVIVTMTGTIGVLMVLIVATAIRTRNMPGPAELVGAPVRPGTEGVVQAPLAPNGTAYLAGEPWSARTSDGRALDRDTPVRLVGFEGLTAIVEPIEPIDPFGKPPKAVPSGAPGGDRA
jgi:membrane-bound serine protease (ClpP class)